MFISFEGIDGCGKSTQITLLKDYFEEHGRSCKVFREPGGTDLSEKVRSILLDKDLKIDPFPELLLFSAARAQLVSECIEPSLAAGDVVICDRFFDSTTAYQAAGRGIVSIEWAKAFHLEVTRGLVPDLTFLLDLSPEMAKERIGDREKDRMEQAGDAFFERVRSAFLDLAESEDRFRIIDASSSIKDIQEQIRSQIDLQ